MAVKHNFEILDIGPGLPDNYCAYTPFMFAFVILIFQWVLFPLLICCECMVICAVCCVGVAAAGSATYSATATSDPSTRVSTSAA